MSDGATEAWYDDFGANKKSKRPSKEEYFLSMATLVGTRATCARRQVGCILVNGRSHVLATGYNGVAAGMRHCIDTPCPGAGLPSGEGLDMCEAIHAEQNALLQCRDQYDIHTAYVTVEPCITCAKLLLNTSCKTIISGSAYVSDHSAKARTLWERAGRLWIVRGSTIKRH